MYVTTDRRFVALFSISCAMYPSFVEAQSTNAHPSVSPDGMHILTRFRPGSFNSDMSFSPDGRAVLFESFIGTVATGQIYAVGTAGGDPRQLAEGTDPKWSPTGSHIAFKYHDATTDRYWLHVMKSDGTDDRILAEGTMPSWFPDGRRLAFRARVGDGWQIHVVDIHNGKIVALTH